MSLKLKIGDTSDNGQITIIDEDRLCYLVKSASRGAEGIRTISKSLLSEYIAYFSKNPNASANDARDTLSGRSDIDKFEYGYTSTLKAMAQMELGQIGITTIQIDNISNREFLFPLQRIFYGAPGTGKSYSVKNVIKEHEPGKIELSMEHERAFRTTFHPDYDYAQFVGCYKPKKEDDKITYDFTPQVFTKALVKSYENSDESVYLVIEEINRGNCAQIFGDIFQLLDRNANGESEYAINVDEDLKKYLQDYFSGSEKIDEEYKRLIDDGKIKLPRNFNIIATMNTSDQSLFPMDSAFKRRWEWEYVPVDLSDEVDSSKFEITIDGSKYKWHDFLRAVNVKIKDVTKSEDKQMGNFFIKKSVDAKEFCNKVMFYLWNDISKDYYESNDSLFQYKTGDGTKHFSFNELFGARQFELLKGFMSFVGCEVSNSAKPEETTVSEEPQKEEDNN